MLSGLELSTGATMLGAEADPEALLSVLTFLDNYALLSDHGAKLDWGMTFPGQSRPTNLSELTAMLEDEKTDRNQVITVDGTQITLGDFETMLEIEKEIKRIQNTYFSDHTGELTPGHEAALNDLRNQIMQDGGIELYNTNGANDLVFPSGTDHSQRIHVPDNVTVAVGQTAAVTITLDHPAQNEVSFDWEIQQGSLKLAIDGNQTGTAVIPAGQSSVTLTLKNGDKVGAWNKDAVGAIQFTNPTGALFTGDRAAATTAVTANNSGYTFLSHGDFSKEDTTITWDGGKLEGHNVTLFMSYLPNGSPMHFTYGMEMTSDCKKLINEGTVTDLDAYVEVWNWGFHDDTNWEQTIKAELYLDKVEGKPYATMERQIGMRDGQGVNFPLDDKIRNASHVFVVMTFTLSHPSDNPYNENVSFRGLRLIDTVPPKILSIEAPEGNYYPGQKVPVTVTTSEYLQLPHRSGLPMHMKTSWGQFSAADCANNKVTFLAAPEDSSPYGALAINSFHAFTDNERNQVDAYNVPLADRPKNIVVVPSIYEALRMPDAAATVSPVYDAKTDTTIATAKVEIPLPDNQTERNLVVGSYNNIDGVICNDKFAASIDGGQTLVPFTYDNDTSPTKLIATFPIDVADIQPNFVMEIYNITVNGKQPVKGDIVLGRYGAFSVNEPIPLRAEHLSVKQPDNWPSEGIYLDKLPDLQLKAQVTGAEGCTWTQYEWKSTNEAVATIGAQDGKISFLREGEVQFYLAAVNGGLEKYQGDGFESERSGVITVQQGATPYIAIAQKELSVRAGEPVTVRWASNIAQKNEEFQSGAPTEFEITVKDASGAVIKTQTVSFDPANKGETDEEKAAWPNQAYTFTDLNTISTGGTPSYTISVTGRTHEGVPGHLAEGFTSEEMKVFVVSQPVTVKLDRPDNLIITDDQKNFQVDYTLENFDGLNDADFRVSVTNNATGEKVPVGEVKPEERGSFTFPLEISDGFRNIYDVTVEAKNPAENSWSRDSYTLYVYARDCLSIVVPEGENGRVAVDGKSITLDNNPWIASLSQDDIIALKRDINLKTLLSINYGDHDWSEAIDRIQWKSGDSGVASVNYPMQSTYANIEELPYTSFAPATEFLLSGNRDGKTVVEAIHELSGGALHDEVEVEVKTLLDKLYLFQSYPAGVTTLTYQNGAGKEKTVQSNDKGQAAIYEPSGIQGEVYFQAEVGGDTYLGTFYNDTLRTQEYNAASLALYPLNTIEMKQASTAPVYLKKPDGTDYSGKVQVRAGVYRNGVYCGEARVDNQTAGTGENAVDYTVNFADGKHEFKFDIMQFDVSSQGPVSPADQIDFVFELRAEGYYPVLYKLNGTLNADQVIRLGEQIVNLETVRDSDREKPFIAQQRVCFTETAEGRGVDVRGLSTRMGPSRDNPKLLLETVVAWWGEDAGQKVDIATKNDVALGALPETDTKYPFTSFDVTVTRTPLNDDSMRAAGIGDLASTALRANYIKTDGTTAKREDLPFTVINATSLKSVVSPEDWTRNLDALRTMGRSSSGGIDAGGEGFMNDGLKQSTLLDIDLGFLKMQLSPTEDPLVYDAYLFAGLNNIENDNVSGAQADVSRGSDFDPGPGFKDVASVLKDGLLNYGQTAANKVKYAAGILKNNIRQGKGTSVSEDGDTLFALSGYFETKVYYDGESWKMVLVNGGLTAGGGYGRHMIFNTQVGPVPMFLDLGYGLSGVVNFKAAVNHTYNYNDYLTELRINGYFQAFGGFGFDYTVLAMKIGLYGQVNVDVQLRWLHAMKASDPKVGAKIGVSGSVGFKLQLRILFISYEKILWSYQFSTQTWPIGDWKPIEDYWAEVDKGTFQGIPLNTRLLTANQLMADESSGQAMFEAQGEATLIDRDYLADAGNRWGGGRNGFSLFAVRDGMETILKPAYPEANPVLSTDGSYMFYLDDLDNASDATALRVAASARDGGSGGTYVQGTILSDEGFGDSYIKSAGTGEDSVVVWSRIMKEPAITEAGETITPNIQAMMLSSSDIMVATRDGGSWNVERLTDNESIADTAPAVASNGSRTVVVWRQTASSSSEDITDFNAKDYIMYRVKEGDTWTDAAPLYTGDLGAVKGLEAHMLDSGEALVTFVADTTGAQDCSGQEVVYAVIAPDEATDGKYAKNEVSRFVRLTSDDYLDENPQLTSATYQGQEYFILGWHSYNGGSGVAESDIRLAAIDGSGNRRTDFVDRLSNLTQNSGTRIGSNFRFVKNADALEQLSILWSEVAVEEKTDPSAASKEKITGIRFRVDGGDIGVTAAQELVVMDDGTTANLFDGYVGDDGDIELVVLGTHYDMEKPQANFVTDGVGVQTVFTPTQTTSIYKASGYFSDEMRLEEPIPDYNQIRLGADLPVLFHLTNAGATPIEKVEITVGGETTTFEAGGASGFVSLKPGENRDLFAYCLLPADEIQNEDYSVKTTFESGKTDETSGTVVLKIPDLGITANEPVIEAKDGKRTLQFTLFNMSDTKLKGSGNQVCFQLFTDPSCKVPVDSKYLSLIQQTRNSPDALLTIADGDSLEKIDEGRLSLQYSFDVASYIQQETDGQKPFADEAGEIRDGGITLYAKAWVETSDGNGGMGEMMEYRSDNNVSAFTVESLLKQSGNEPVKLQSELTADGGGTTVAVTVTLQNNSIVESQDGNLSVTLLDDQNNIVGWHQSYDEDGNLFTLTPEQEYEKAFTFPGVSGAARALVTFDKKVTLNDDATLNQFSATGVPVDLSKFTQQPDGSYSATVTAEDMTNTIVTASPNSTKSKVTISANTPEVKTTLLAAEASGGTKTVTMSPGGTTVITATVKAENGAEKTYTLTITNKNSAPDITDQTPKVSAVYGADTVTLTVSANVKDNESARLSYQWYRYDGSGRPGNPSDSGWKPVEGATEATYTIDKGGLSAGTHYYYCKVTSTNTAGASFTADSEIVPVDVSQAETPTINWPKVGTPLTFGDPLSNAGEDLKSGSLTFPNGFTPEYEIGTFTWMQPEAIPTVDTTQANAVYTPSQEILRNYKSFALMSGNVPQMLDITVNKAAAPTATWPTAAAITYGQTLEDAALSGGALNFGDAFDFTKNPAFSGNPIGTFTWNQPDAVPAVVNSGFQVDYAASDFVQTNYDSINGTSHTTPLTVNRAAPTVNVETNVSTQKIGNPVTATITVTNPYNTGLTNGFPEAGQVKVTGATSGQKPESLEVTAVQGRPGVYQATFQIPNDARLNDAALTFSVTLDESGNYQAVTEAKTAQVGITDKSVHVQSLTGLTSVVYGNPAVFTTRLEKGNYGQPAAGQPTGTMTYQLNGRDLTGRNQKLTVTADGSTAVLTLDPSELPTGNYTLTARYSGDNDYQSSTQNINFTVSPRPVTATADDTTAYVGAVPALTVSYDGLPAGVTGLRGIAAQTTATGSSPAGSYPITLTEVSGEDAKNYTVTAIPGTLTLKPDFGEAPIALPGKPDAERHIPAVAVEPAELEKLKDQITDGNLANLKLMVTPVEETGEEAKALLAKLNGYRAPENGTGLYDVSLVDVANGNKVLDFDGSATLTFPYPEGTSDSNYRFVVLHLKDGAVSAYTPVTTGDGLQITVKNGFSPFLVAYAFRSSGGGGSSNNVTVTTPPATPEQPNPPTNGESKVAGSVDKDGNATVKVPDQSITDAINAAKKQAGQNGISVTINITLNKTANRLTVTISKPALDRLITENVKELKITSSLISMSFNAEALKEMQKSVTGDWIITANKLDVKTLSTAAQAAIGSRPAFALSMQSGGKAITGLGKGSASVWMPYALAANEAAGNVQAVYVDEKGAVSAIIGSSYDTNTKMLMFSTNHFSIYGVGYKQDAPKLTDITNHWAKSDIEFVVARGLLSGTGGDQFSPDSGMTRAMFVTALGRLAGIDPAQYQSGSFTDVPANTYYAPYVNWAAAKGIVKGTTQSTFDPNRNVTRQEMAVIMQGYATAMGYTLTRTRDAVTFADSASIGSWAGDAVRAMQQAGILMGKDGNRFDPTGTATRGEAAAVLHRFVELVIDPATAQGWDKNDSGKWVYYVDGKPVTGGRTIDGTTYHFDEKGQLTKIDAIAPETKKYLTYVVKQGDTLWAIAASHHCTVAEIVALNNSLVEDPNKIIVGWQLKIPQK